MGYENRFSTRTTPTNKKTSNTAITRRKTGTLRTYKGTTQKRMDCTIKIPCSCTSLLYWKERQRKMSSHRLQTVKPYHNTRFISHTNNEKTN